MQLGVPGVGDDLAVESVERLHLDAVDDGGHRAFARDPDEEAPGAHPAGQNPLRHRIAAVKIEEQPAIGAELLEHPGDLGAIEFGQCRHS